MSPFDVSFESYDHERCVRFTSLFCHIYVIRNDSLDDATWCNVFLFHLLLFAQQVTLPVTLQNDATDVLVPSFRDWFDNETFPNVVSKGAVTFT